MKKEEIISKLTSRKLWLAIALFASGLITAIVGDGELAETVSGCIMQGAAVIGYIVGEGLVDAKRTSSSTSASNTEAAPEVPETVEIAEETSEDAAQ